MLRHFGPFKTAAGTPVSTVVDSYLQSTDFVRLQELSATFSLPNYIATRLRTAGASVTVGGRNLHLWKSKDWTGPDPGVISNTGTTGQTQYVTFDEFTIPQPRLWLVRLNLQF
jgi:hypothetical protein